MADFVEVWLVAQGDGFQVLQQALSKQVSFMANGSTCSMARVTADLFDSQAHCRPRPAQSNDAASLSGPGSFGA